MSVTQAVKPYLGLLHWPGSQASDRVHAPVTDTALVIWPDSDTLLSLPKELYDLHRVSHMCPSIQDANLRCPSP